MNNPGKLTPWQRYRELQRRFEAMTNARIQPELETLISDLLYLSHDVLTEIDEGWRPLFNQTFKSPAPQEIKPRISAEIMTKVVDILFALRFQRVQSSPTRPPPTPPHLITPLLNMADTNPDFIQVLHDISTGRGSGGLGTSS